MRVGLMCEGDASMFSIIRQPRRSVVGNRAGVDLRASRVSAVVALPRTFASRCSWSSMRRDREANDRRGHLLQPCQRHARG